MKIIPAILEKNFQEIKKKIHLIENDFDLIQIDICDGKFTEEKTWQNAGDLKKLKTKTNFEIHLMTKNPKREIKKWQLKKVKRIVIHWETLNLKDLSWIKDASRKTALGIALNPETKTESLKKIPLEFFSYLLFLGVNPGRQGQKFQKRVIEKIKKIKKAKWLPKNMEIGLDGGVNKDIFKEVKKLKIDYLTIGSCFWKEMVKNLDLWKRFSKKKK